jgi:hypothetical protein
VRPQVLQCLGYAPGAIRLQDFDPSFLFLADYNPEARGGLGHVQWCERARDAMRFTDKTAAQACLDTVPANRITQPGGVVNRPLQAFRWLITEAPTQPDAGVLR